MQIKKKKKEEPVIPTSALPDIIFMLLFFFMAATVLRERDILVETAAPKASQIQKLEKRRLVSFIYVGKPRDVGKFGSEPRIQLNDVLATPENIPQFVFSEKSKLPEVDREKLVVSLKIDRNVKMGIVTDVREKLRESNALKINYASVTSSDEE
ncbi:ExbD/TolR family protein [Hugenholtzia roseola]|uniref:ExbD/TolR family protein n=1 Tax=Hugenholtzia roseola TaxID=1002 RepID=UPI00041D0C40|nr:biopolymer transporter ExbD [Hugenholtzia roseola]